MRLPRKYESEDEAEADSGELSSLLEETVESLSTLVAGWRTELARSAERAAGLEASIGILSSSLETWKAELSRNQSSAEQKLELVLDALDSAGTAQSQATIAEIQSATTATTSQIAKSMEDLKAEIRYGSGLAEVKVLAAIENLGGQMGQIKGSLEEWKTALAESGSRSEARTLRALEAIEQAIGRTGSAVEQIADSLGPHSTSLTAARDSLESMIGKLAASVQEWHGQVGLAAASTEKRLVLSLEALETGIELGLSARQELEKRVLSRLDELDANRSEYSERQERLERSLETLAGNVEGWREQAQQTARSIAGGLELENKIMLRLEELDLRLSRSKDESAQRGETLEATLNRIARGLEAWHEHIPDAALAEAAAEIGTNIVTAVKELEIRLAGSEEERREREARLRSTLESLTRNLHQWHEQTAQNGDGAGALQFENIIVAALEELETRMARSQEEGRERQKQLEEGLRSLSGTLEQWSAGDFHALADLTTIHSWGGHLDQRLQDLEKRLTQSQADNAKRQERLEATLTALAQDIGQWQKGKRGDDADVRDRIVESLKALEAKIELTSPSTGVRTSLSDDLADLRSAVAQLASGIGRYGAAVVSVDDLEHYLRKGTQDLDRLARTFDKRLEQMELDMEDAMVEHISQLETSIIERNKALVTLILGSRPEPDAFEKLGPRRRR